MTSNPNPSLEKVTLNLSKGDKETLASFYPAMGWSVAARRVIHKFCAKLREVDSQEVMVDNELLDVEVSVEDIEG